MANPEEGPRGRLVSSHRFGRWIIWFLFTPFLLGTAYHAVNTLPATHTSYPGEKVVSIIVLLVVWVGFAAALSKLGRLAVWLYEDGLQYRLQKGAGFFGWDMVASYQFTRVIAPGGYGGHAAIANAIFDPGHLKRGSKFSRSGGGNNFVATVTATDGRNFAINSGFSGMRRFCETVVAQTDTRILPKILARLQSGEAVAFGEVVLDGRNLTSPNGLALPVNEVADVLVLDGQVWVDDGTKKVSIGSVPNAYALQSALRSLREMRA